MLMGEKRKKFVSVLLAFSLVALSGNSMAQFLSRSVREGAKLRIQKNDGQLVTGELITVKKNSLLLLDSETDEDLSVDIKDVNAITLVKKSRGFQVGIYGVLAGILYASANRKTFKYEDKSQDFWMTGIYGGAAGVALGTVLGINKRIQIEGKSDTEIQQALEKLSKKARVPGIQ